MHFFCQDCQMHFFLSSSLVTKWDVRSSNPAYNNVCPCQLSYAHGDYCQCILIHKN